MNVVPFFNLHGWFPDLFLDPWNTALDLPISSSSPQAPTPSSPCAWPLRGSDHAWTLPPHTSHPPSGGGVIDRAQVKHKILEFWVRWSTETKTTWKPWKHFISKHMEPWLPPKQSGTVVVLSLCLCCYHCWPTVATTNAWSVILERAAEVNEGFAWVVQIVAVKMAILCNAGKSWERKPPYQETEMVQWSLIQKNSAIECNVDTQHLLAYSLRQRIIGRH